MTESPPYDSPAAFRRALTDRLRAIASPRGPWPLPDLQRQFAYDRLLVRLYERDPDWIVKGATALLARQIAARHTVDVDVYRAASLRHAEHDFRAGLALDAGDWFRFELGPSVPLADAERGLRIPVDALLGATKWASFHVDLVGEGVRMTGAPDAVPPLVPIQLPGLARPGYRAYPLVDHVSDKTCAILERHGPAHWPSTRYKDLVDLVVLALHARVDAGAQQAALHSEAERRGLVLPDRFNVPDRVLWERGYAAEARRAVELPATTLDAALALVRPFLDPLLDDTAVGTWHPEQGRWQQS